MSVVSIRLLGSWHDVCRERERERERERFFVPDDGAVLVTPDKYQKALDCAKKSADMGVVVTVFVDAELLIEWRARIATRRGSHFEPLIGPVRV